MARISHWNLSEHRETAPFCSAGDVFTSSNWLRHKHRSSHQLIAAFSRAKLDIGSYATANGDGNHFYSIADDVSPLSTLQCSRSRAFFKRTWSTIFKTDNSTVSPANITPLPAQWLFTFQSMLASCSQYWIRSDLIVLQTIFLSLKHPACHIGTSYDEVCYPV